jgi:hypothetical protein
MKGPVLFVFGDVEKQKIYSDMQNVYGSDPFFYLAYYSMYEYILYNTVSARFSLFILNKQKFF